MNAPLLWLSLLRILGAAVVLASVPLLLELVTLSLTALLPPRRPATRSAGPQRLAVIVPAHNEETLIAACVHSLLASPGQADQATPLEVFVVAHNCTDRTAERALAAGARVLPFEGPGGKGLALDHGFRHALALGADALLVIDADSQVAPDLPSILAGAICAGAGAVQVRYQAGGTEVSLRTRLASLALFGMNVVRPRGRSRLGLSCGIFGNGFALSAATLARVPYTANSLVEDLEYHLRLVRAGIRVHYLDNTTVFGELPDQSAAAASQRARWEGGRALMRREWTLPLTRAVLRGQWALLEPLLDLLAPPLATGAALFLVAALVPVAPVRLYGLAGLLTVALYVLVSAALSPRPAQAFKALAAAPGYLVWKILLIPRTRLASSRDAAWVRTARNADVPVTRK